MKLLMNQTSHNVKSSLQKNLVNSSVALIPNGWIMINGHLGFIETTDHKKHAFCYIYKNISQMQQLMSKMQMMHLYQQDLTIGKGLLRTAFEQHRQSKYHKESEY